MDRGGKVKVVQVKEELTKLRQTTIYILYG